MNRIVSTLLAGCTLLALPLASAEAASNATPMVVAQNIQLGPNGVRIEGDRNRGEGRRFEERRGGFDRDRDQRRRFEPTPRCRIYVVRHRTPYGMRTERVRRCG